MLRNSPRPKGSTAIGILLLTLSVSVVATRGVATANAASLRDEQHCLALNMYWEARGEGRQGMIAVGWTVLNRVRSRQFAATPCEIIRQGGEQPPCQFSWWCDGKSDLPRDQNSWRSAQIIAADLLVNPPPDPTHGALYFHSTSIRPPWQRDRTVQIGRHVFYR